MDSVTTRMAFSIAEFCERNGVCRDTAYKENKRGQLKIRKVGKKSIITAEDEREWRNSRPLLERTA
jgi:predicted site-specific integrase-resolvase